MTTAEQEITTPREQEHASKQTAIRVGKLTKHYGALEAVRGIELEVSEQRVRAQHRETQSGACSGASGG